jgi:cystathionine beta-lyase family protein involved in aluminum resistance
LISLTGAPYDTLLATVGIHPDDNGIESILDHGTIYQEIPLLDGTQVNLDTVCATLKDGKYSNIVYLQRSRGYDWRPSLSIEQIGRIINAVKAADPNCIVLVDNCYGEFTEVMEPTEVGADLIAGSLIKNPGGGLAPTGGYIAGRRNLVERVQYRMTAPGIGAEVGSWPSGYQSFYQGLFLAPHTVGESLKGATMAAAVFETLGYPVMPGSADARSDITQSIEFGESERLLSFCRVIQSASPVDGHVIPEPWPMPGYQHDVVMAAGTFVQGASIELSADAPIKPPFIGYLQGGLTYQHCALAMMMVLTELLK